MIPTSEAYKWAVAADERWAYARVIMSLFDPDAAGAATVTSTGAESFSRLPQVCDENMNMSYKWASYEGQGFPLDGSVYVPPKAAQVPSAQMGFWSTAISDAFGSVGPVTVTATFSQLITSIGVTIAFDTAMGRYGVDFSVSVYVGQTLLAQKSITDNDQTVVVLEMLVANYNQVVVTVTKWSHANARVRIAEILLGVIEVRDSREDITSLNVLWEVDLTSESVPSDEMAVRMQNFARRFDMSNPEGIYKHLVDAYPIDLDIGVGESHDDIHEVLCKRYYFQQAEGVDGQTETDIIARGKVNSLKKSLYRMGRLAQLTAYDAAAEILRDAGETDYSIDPALRDVTVMMAIPIVSHIEALRMVAQAGMACIFVDRQNQVHVARVSIGAPVGEISGEVNATKYPQPQIGEYYNAVSTRYYTYRDSGGSSATIGQTTVAGSGTQDVWIKFESPAAGVNISVSGGTLNTYTAYLYGAKVRVTGSGNIQVTATGRNIETTEAEYLFDQSGSDAQRIWNVENPLVATTAHAQRVAQWRYNLWQQRLIYELSWRGDPSLDVADTVTVVDEYGQPHAGIAVTHEISFDGTLSEETKTVGSWDR